jgi:hypothetical protein
MASSDLARCGSDPFSFRFDIDGLPPSGIVLSPAQLELFLRLMRNRDVPCDACGSVFGLTDKQLDALPHNSPGGYNYLRRQIDCQLQSLAHLLYRKIVSDARRPPSIFPDENPRPSLWARLCARLGIKPVKADAEFCGQLDELWPGVGCMYAKACAAHRE